MRDKIKISKSILRSFMISMILIAIAIASIIIGIFNVINTYLGYIAFLIASLIWIFFIGYKYIINIKNWYLRAILTGLTITIIVALINRQSYLLQMLIMILGIIFSIIIQYKIYTKKGEIK
jgi:hypothetical protein